MVAVCFFFLQVRNNTYERKSSINNMYMNGGKLIGHALLVSTQMNVSVQLHLLHISRVFIKKSSTLFSLAPQLRFQANVWPSDWSETIWLTLAVCLTVIFAVMSQFFYSFHSLTSGRLYLSYNVIWIFSVLRVKWVCKIRITSRLFIWQLLCNIWLRRLYF